MRLLHVTDGKLLYMIEAKSEYDAVCHFVDMHTGGPASRDHGVRVWGSDVEHKISRWEAQQHIYTLDYAPRSVMRLGENTEGIKKEGVR